VILGAAPRPEEFATHRPGSRERAVRRGRLLRAARRGPASGNGEEYDYETKEAA
jgi:hypothetical protein